MDLDHLDRGVKSDVEKLCDNYSLAWSKGKFDMREFTAFQVDIPTFEGSRKLKDHVRQEIRPLMDELVREGIFSPDDKQGQFCSNLNCVPKPVKGKVTLGKADLHIDKM